MPDTPLYRGSRCDLSGSRAASPAVCQQSVGACRGRAKTGDFDGGHGSSIRSEEHCRNDVADSAFSVANEGLCSASSATTCPSRSYPALPRCAEVFEQPNFFLSPYGSRQVQCAYARARGQSTRRSRRRQSDQEGYGMTYGIDRDKVALRIATKGLGVTRHRSSATCCSSGLRVQPCAPSRLRSSESAVRAGMPVVKVV